MRRNRRHVSAVAFCLLTLVIITAREGFMGFFQLRSLPGTVWPGIAFPQVSLVWNAYQELDRTQWLSADEIQKQQLRQLNALFNHVRRNVPYYAQLFERIRLRDPIESLDEFRKIPRLTRELYQANFESIQARQLPDGMSPTAKGGYTSGTSGVPIKVLKTSRDTLWWNAFFLRDLEWCGIDPIGNLAAIRLLAYTPETLPAALAGGYTPQWNKAIEMLIETGRCFGMDIRQDPRKQLEWLRNVDPDYLLSMPTNLEFLAALVRESGQRLPKLKVIQAVGESLPRDVRTNIEEGFGVPVKNLYSTTEGGYMASECPQGHGLHVHAESVLCEVLNDRDEPCKSAETGRLVFTNLHNFITPFIRYEILDEVTLGDGLCPCGRGLPLWKHVEGRVYPSLHLSDGRKKSSMGVVLGLRQVAGAHQFQMIQRNVGHAIVRVVPNRDWTIEHPQRIREVLHREFESDIDVQIEQCQMIDRPKGGKLRLVVIEVE
jgi:phenylacetate-CoA ligase